MTHTYQVEGMTCRSCEGKVKSSLLSLPDVTAAEASKDEKTVTVTMDKHISLDTLQKALGGKDSKYTISALEHNELAEQARSWWQTYKPVLLIFGYITLVTFLVQLAGAQIDYMQWMRHFMAGFFLVFSFFKLLNLQGFADSYAMYDIVAKRARSWGYIYAFVELSLGLAYLTDFNPLAVNIITLVVMSVSIIGVLQSVLNRKQIQCACLGAVFNLPMSTITIIEDALMIGMSAVMLFAMY